MNARSVIIQPTERGFELRADQVVRNVELFRHPIPVALWAELKQEGLLREDAPVPS